MTPTDHARRMIEMLRELEQVPHVKNQIEDLERLIGLLGEKV